MADGELIYLHNGTRGLKVLMDSEAMGAGLI